MDLVNNKLVVSHEYQWKLLKRLLDCEHYFYSECFKINLGDISTKWQIVLYHTKSDKLFAYLHKISSTSNDFEVNYSLFANSLTHRKNAPEIHEIVSNGSIINGHWIKIGNASSLFTGLGTTSEIISFDLILKISLKEIHPDNECGPVLKKFCSNNESFLFSEVTSDFVFNCCDGEKIYAHRFILAAQSPVLRTMINVNTTKCKNIVSKLNDIDSETMREFLRFLYAAKVENLEKLAPKLLYCAEKYQVNGLKYLCVQEMMKNLSVDNVVEYWTLANRYSEENLELRCILFMKRNYEKIFQDEKNQDLLNRKPNLKLSSLLRRESLPYKSALKPLFRRTKNEIPNGYMKFYG